MTISSHVTSVSGQPFLRRRSESGSEGRSRRFRVAALLRILRHGEDGLLEPQGHRQPHQVEGAAEAALVLPDVPEAVPGRGKERASRDRGSISGRTKRSPRLG